MNKLSTAIVVAALSAALLNSAEATEQPVPKKGEVANGSLASPKSPDLGTNHADNRFGPKQLGCDVPYPYPYPYGYTPYGVLMPPIPSAAPPNSGSAAARKAAAEKYREAVEAQRKAAKRYFEAIEAQRIAARQYAVQRAAAFQQAVEARHNQVELGAQFPAPITYEMPGVAGREALPLGLDMPDFPPMSEPMFRDPPLFNPPDLDSVKADIEARRAKRMQQAEARRAEIRKEIEARRAELMPDCKKI